MADRRASSGLAEMRDSNPANDRLADPEAVRFATTLGRGIMKTGTPSTASKNEQKVPRIISSLKAIAPMTVRP